MVDVEDELRVARVEAQVEVLLVANAQLGCQGSGVGSAARTELLELEPCPVVGRACPSRGTAREAAHRPRAAASGAKGWKSALYPPEKVNRARTVFPPLRAFRGAAASSPRRRSLRHHDVEYRWSGRTSPSTGFIGWRAAAGRSPLVRWRPASGGACVDLA